jgi:hypothetical protein
MHGGEVDDHVRSGVLQRVRHVPAVPDVHLDELGFGGQPRTAAARQVVEYGHVVSGSDQTLDQMAPDEARAAGDDHAPRHQASSR